MAYLEHVNVTVADPKTSAALLQDLFDWQIRWEGHTANDGYTIHIGTKDCYVALYSGQNAKPGDGHAADYGIQGYVNHIGVVVADLAQAEARVRAAGLVPGEIMNYEPGQRFYFREDNGLEIEVVSYS